MMKIFKFETEHFNIYYGRTFYAHIFPGTFYAHIFPGQ